MEDKQPIILKLSPASSAICNDLLSKYESFSFESSDEEGEFLNQLKVLLNTTDDDIEFEYKMVISQRFHKELV